MSPQNELGIETNEQGKTVYRFITHRRTITETDIVNFVNLVGLHEPPFIDMEWVKQTMPGLHNKRFAPAPFLISLGMGLLSTSVMKIMDIMSEREKLGLFHGMVGLEAAVKNPAFPDDTVHVEVEAFVDRKTSKGQTIVDLKHVLVNQSNEVVTIFTEKLLFESRE